MIYLKKIIVHNFITYRKQTFDFDKMFAKLESMEKKYAGKWVENITIGILTAVIAAIIIAVIIAL